MSTGITTSTSPSSVQYEFITRLQKRLVPNAKQYMFLDQFADKDIVPQRSGSKTMRYFKKPDGDYTRVSTLTEGTAISTFQQLDVNYVDVSLAQIGEVQRVSDVLYSQEFFNRVDLAKEVFAKDCAWYADRLIASILVAGVSSSGSTVQDAISGAYSEMFSGVANTGTSQTDFTSLHNLTKTSACITEKDVIKGITALHANGGELEAIVMPDQVYADFFQDSTMRGAANFNPEKRVFKGQVDAYMNYPIVRTNRPWRENTTAGVYSASGNVYSTFFIGSGAYATPVWSVDEAGTDPVSPRWIMAGGADSGNPLNQFSSIGWKAYWNAVSLKPTWHLVLRSKSKTF